MNYDEFDTFKSAKKYASSSDDVDDDEQVEKSSDYLN